MINDPNHAVQGASGKAIKGIGILHLDMDPDELQIYFEDGSIVLLDNNQQCCETRFMHTDDNFGDFLGATFLGAEVLDGPTIEIPGSPKNERLQESQFLVISTSVGKFTVVNYNRHNGYYDGFKIEVKNLSVWARPPISKLVL